jgi:hypothetical protein
MQMYLDCLLKNGEERFWFWLIDALAIYGLAA